MSIRAIAWDIDGTLLDSEPLHHEALVAACAGWGADLSDLPDQAFRGVHMHDVWNIISPRLPASLDKITWLDAIESCYVARRHQLQPVQGAVETIAAISAHGMPQVCVSNSSRRIVEANIAALGISSQIAFAISLDDVENGKPDPQGYATARRRLGLEPHAVAAVEDSATGAHAARAAGLIVVGFAPDGCGLDDVDHTIDAIPRLLDIVGAPRPGASRAFCAAGR